MIARIGVYAVLLLALSLSGGCGHRGPSKEEAQKLQKEANFHMRLTDDEPTDTAAKP